MKKIFTILMLACLNTVAFTQTPSEEVMKPINQLFEGMKNADSAMVRSAFMVNAKMYTAYVSKTGKQTIIEGLLSKFLTTIANKPANTPDWNEKLFNTEIKVDGNIAQVWTEYSFFVGDKFSHCGVNAFQLMKDNTGWKIIHIMDTRRKENCNETFSD